jgi:hypothetical protein
MAVKEQTLLWIFISISLYFGKYVKGMTTFFRVMGEIGQDAFSHLSYRLEVLNRLHPLKRELESVITQYKKGDIKNFAKVCKKIPGVNLKTQKKAGCFCSTLHGNINYVFTFYDP